MLTTWLFEIFWFIAFGFAFAHLSKSKSWKDAVIFFVPALMWGFLIEFFGIYFYKMYYYSNYLLSIADVPLAIAFGWAAIIYAGYYLTAKTLQVKKLLKIDVETAAVSTIFDILILEPMAFSYRLWIWTANDFWFSAPLFNFVGWFFAVSIFVLSYSLITKYVEGRRMQFLYMMASLAIGITCLHAIGLSYKFLFGIF